MSAIADLVAILNSTGIPPEKVSELVDLVVKHGIEQVEIHRNSTGIPPENAWQKRKAWDRERKRNSTGKQKSASYLLTSLSNTSSEETLKEVSKERIRPRASKKRAEPLPDDWKPNIDHHRLAAATGVAIEDVEPRFRDYLKSNGKQYADYDAALRTFIRNTPKFNGTQRHGQTPKRSIIQAADDLCRKIASFDGPSSEDLELCDREGAPVAGMLPDRRRQRS